MRGTTALPRLMGVVNVTPDSFSDGGQWYGTTDAVEHALRLLDEGADIVDVGGESTRPGASPVDATEELARTIPVIRGIRAARPSAVISIDTSKSRVAHAAVEAGASIVNDVTAGTHDKTMLSMVASLGVPYIAMHMRGQPRTMQERPHYNDVVAEVQAFLAERLSAAREAGIQDVWLDPGIGFGKTLEHNLSLLRSLSTFVAMAPVVLGISRKRFLGALTGIEDAAQRDAATMVTHALLLHHGCAVIRIHNVAMARGLLDIAHHIA